MMPDAYDIDARLIDALAEAREIDEITLGFDVTAQPK